MRNKSLPFIFFLFAFLGLIAKPVPAFADLSLDKVLIDFKPGARPVDTINITNTADKSVKVTVSTIESKNPGLPGEAEAPTDKVVVAPKAFELGPHESRAVRIVLRSQPENAEEIYRVRFMPDQVSFEKKVEAANGTSVNVGVVVSMGALITVTPKNVHADLQFKREGSIIHFINAGNVTAQLQREDYCTGTGDKRTCVPLKGWRLYPGTKWDMDVPDGLKDAAFDQTVLINGAYSKLSYPAR